jgi:hypothetical protein
MSLMLLGILNAQASGGAISYDYWVSFFDGANIVGPRSVVSDSNSENDIYLLSRSFSTPTDFSIAKFASGSSLQWQRTLTGASNSFPSKIAIDDSGNSYITGTTDASGRVAFLAKYNSSGVIQWQKTILTNDQPGEVSLGIDPSGNIYWSFSPLGGNFAGAIKLNSFGVIQWQKKYVTPDAYEHAPQIAVNGSVLYISGASSNGPPQFSNAFLLAVSTSDGSIIWQRGVTEQESTSVGNNQSSSSLTTDSAGSIIVGLNIDTVVSGNSTDQFGVVKFNSSGSFQWASLLGQDTVTNQTSKVTSVSTDSNNNVYALGYTSKNSTAGRDMFLVKYNSSGTIQYQRTIGGATASSTGSAIFIDSNDDMLISGDVLGNGWSLKLPSNGGLTGTHTIDGYSFQYKAGSVSVLSPQVTSYSENFVASDASSTMLSGELTDAGSSFSNTTEIME